MLSISQKVLKEEDVLLLKSTTNSYPKMMKVQHKWIIHDFGVVSRYVQNLSSSSFPVCPDGIEKEVLKWHLTLAKDTENDQYSIYLYLDSPIKSDIFAEVIFCLVDKNGLSQNVKPTSSKKFSESQGKAWGIENFFKNTMLNKDHPLLLPNNSLTILCEIYYLSTIINAVNYETKDEESIDGVQKTEAEFDREISIED